MPTVTSVYFHLVCVLTALLTQHSLRTNMPTTRSQLSTRISTHKDEQEETQQQILPVQQSDPPLDANPAQSNRSPSALDYVDRVTQLSPKHDRPLSPAPHQQFQPSPTPARQQGFFQPPDKPSLAQAIIYMMETLRPREHVSTKRAKSKEPDTFDGSDPKKAQQLLNPLQPLFPSEPVLHGRRYKNYLRPFLSPSSVIRARLPGSRNS